MPTLPLLQADQLARLDRPGPRYTSYPTADRFVDSFGPAQLQASLAERRQAPQAGSLSLYVHVPFCESVCYYCGCNKIVTRHHERAAPYLDALASELALWGQALEPQPPLTQLHLGGGTPTFLSDDELARLMDLVRERFALLPDAELSIEIDPRTVNRTRLAHLRALGFNRASLGVQDFDPAVQQAVNRVQPFKQVQALLNDARALGFASINVDLIYGLPQQSAASLARTIAQVQSLRPDRVAMYAYAHLPERFKPQRRIDAQALPPPHERLAMLAQATAALQGAGYDYIGMDHYALPHDALAVAKREGRLHRNFQGYSTQPDCDLIGLGVSAISKIGRSYSQNAKTLNDYNAALEAGRWPVARGWVLSADDALRRELIMGWMCQGRLDIDTFESTHGVRLLDRFGPELAALEREVDAGLVVRTPQGFELTPQGWYAVRSIAMLFDAPLQTQAQAGAGRQIYAKLV
jgi:oxygen-independent coproporphyrinogen III oxidase